jgi:hypothetical protein
MTKQVEKMNTFVKNFLSEHGSEELVEEWEAKTNQEQFMKLCKPLKTTKSTKTKDLNKPKRGKSAYLFFCAAKRSEVKEELEAAADAEGADKPKATDVTRELGRQWNLLKASKKPSAKKLLTQCEEEAAADKERYEAEMAHYEPLVEDKFEVKKKSSANKDPNKPKRCKSAYLFFCAAKRSEVKEELEAAANESGADKPKATDVTKELGRQWNLLKESKKPSDKKLLFQCEEEASADKERYKTEMTDYHPPEEEDEAEKEEEDEAEKEEEDEADQEEEEEDEAEKEEIVVRKKSENKQVKVSGWKKFYKNMKPKIQEQDPEATTKDITKQLAAQWKSMDSEEKKEWD